MGVKKVILIDDSEICLEAASETLRAAGYEVRTFLQPSPEGQSLAFFLADHLPDLILCDVDMPFLKGDAIAQTIKSNPHYKSIKICFHSSKPPSELEHLVKTSGADGFVPKSSDTAALLAKVRQLAG